MSSTCDLLGLLGILLTPLVAVIFFLLGLRVQRPKLIGAGTGSGTMPVPARNVHAAHVAFRNHPTFLGIKVRKEDATIVLARLYDPDLKMHVGGVLRWPQSGSPNLVQGTTIRAGKSETLYVFGKELGTDSYFIFSSNSLDSPLPTNLVRYKEAKKDFSIELSDELERKYRFDISVNHAEQVSIRFKLTLIARIEYLQEAFEMLRRALSLRR
jgi:hypothetical protein